MHSYLLYHGALTPLLLTVEKNREHDPRSRYWQIRAVQAEKPRTRTTDSQGEFGI